MGSSEEQQHSIINLKINRNFGGNIMFFEEIAKLIAERTGCDITELGIDSLDTVEILMELEDIAGVELELDSPVETVEDLDKFIQSKKG